MDLETIKDLAIPVVVIIGILGLLYVAFRSPVYMEDNGKRYQYRDNISGRYVTKKYAEANPHITSKEVYDDDD